MPGPVSIQKFPVSPGMACTFPNQNTTPSSALSHYPRKNPPERVVSSWLGMEDYSACSLTLRGRRCAPRGATLSHEKTRRSGLFRYGWGWRIRTSTDGVRVRSPAVRRIPKCLEPPDRRLRGHINAWSTADACAPCADRPSYVQPHGHRGSGSRHDASGCAALRRSRRGRGQCRDGWRRPDRWYHLP